jgi:hypothetical protein
MLVFLQVAAEAARAVQRSSQDRSEGEREYHGFVPPEQNQMSGGASDAEMKSQTTREPLPWQEPTFGNFKCSVCCTATVLAKAALWSREGRTLIYISPVSMEKHISIRNTMLAGKQSRLGGGTAPRQSLHHSYKSDMWQASGRSALNAATTFSTLAGG